MRIAFSISLLLLYLNLFAQNSDTETRNKLAASGSFSINSNGIASVPAFTLGDPAFITSFSLAKGRFSYDPTMGYSLDLKPWFFDNWLHYKFLMLEKLDLRAGFNYCTFFQKYSLPDQTVHEAQQYFTYALEAFYTFKPRHSLQLAYWYDRGMDPRTMIGHFASVMWERTEIELTTRLELSGSIQLFYINYTGNNDGLFAAAKISSAMKNLPLSLYFQGIQAISSNTEPFPGFSWNIGLAYHL